MTSVKVERKVNEDINNYSISNNSRENDSINDINNINKDVNNIFDTMLIFDFSKQNFYVEGEKGKVFNNKIINNILEKELNSQEKETKTFYLNNDLYSILIKKKKGQKIQKLLIMTWKVKLF